MATDVDVVAEPSTKEEEEEKEETKKEEDDKDEKDEDAAKVEKVENEEQTEVKETPEEEEAKESVKVEEKVESEEKKESEETKEDDEEFVLVDKDDIGTGDDEADAPVARQHLPSIGGLSLSFWSCFIANALEIIVFIIIFYVYQTPSSCHRSSMNKQNKNLSHFPIFLLQISMR